MLLQTNSYVVPKEKRAEHARLMRRFRQVLNRLGCDSFEVYEQVGANWSNTQTSGRFVQIMRFRDRKHQLAVQSAERSDQTAQELIAEFCELVNYPYQQQQGQFAVGFYSSVLPISPVRGPRRPGEEPAAGEGEPEQGDAGIEAVGAAFGAAGAAGAAMADPGEAQGLLESGAPADFAAPAQPLSEADEERAAGEFAQAADRGEPVADQPAGPLAAEETARDEEHEPSLPTLDAEDLLGTAEGAESPLAEPQAAVDHEPAETPNPATPPAELEDFVLDDLDGGGEIEMTDDDLARLAQELSDEPREAHGGAAGDAANPGSR